MSTAVGSEPQLLALRKLAEEMARRRREAMTTTHLLAAVAARSSEAAELLRARNLSAEVLLRGAKTAGQDRASQVNLVLQRAKELAVSMGASEPSAAHLLVALLSESGIAARRALEQHGVHTTRLRTAAQNLGLGWFGRRRTQDRAAVADSSTRPARVVDLASQSRPATGVALPLVPGRSQGRAALAKVPPSPASDPGNEKSQAKKVAPRGRVVECPTLARRANGATRTPAAGPGARASHFQLDAQRFPTLAALGNNLTAAALRGELDPVIGRDDEIEQALDVLAKRHANNPCLVGLAGVGKTSVARGMAQWIAAGKGTGSLDDRIIIEIPIAELLAGTGVRGALAQRVSSLRKEVRLSAGRVVLFFDEIHQLFAGEGAEEMGAELKVALAKGELPCIGTTTEAEYRARIDSDPALVRRFSVIEVAEPSREDAFLIADAVSTQLAEHHCVSFEEEAVALAVGWSVRYLPARALPEKAISVLDLAGARAHRRGLPGVGRQTVAEVIAGMADMPIERLLETDAERMLNLEQALAERVVGHLPQLSRISQILRRNAAGLGSARPIGTFLLLGPTGVGKTETAKAVADVLFHSEHAMTRVDMSEYSEAHAVARLIGAPPGYVGHEAGGYLTESVRRRPYQVLLLDEVEKAHPDVLLAFLAVFDEGRLTDGRGRTVDFTNTVMLLTSNIGSEETGSARRRAVGFGAADAPSVETLDARVTAAARSRLAPELYNRIDEILVFAPLARAEVLEIARRLVSRLGATLGERRGIGIQVDDAALEYLLEAGGFDPSLGARPMKRTLARFVEAPLAEKILGGELMAGDVALVAMEGDALTIDVLPGERRKSAC